jgi:glutamyl-tRNA reductase
LIVGKEIFKTCNRRELYSSISANVVLSDSAQNLGARSLARALARVRVCD